ncbi:MAG TPA: FxsA family protein [Deltaproteobacteria bacterium]|nr:FxsA family protein [Deltaproteobacteria bacterium]
MFYKLLLAFILVPIAEIYVLVKVGGYIGALNTVAIVVIVGIAGAYLARLQGMQALFRVRTSLQHGRMPSGEVVDAFLILLAGIMLLLPGFITDLAGLALLFSPTREMIKKQLMKRIDVWLRSHTIHINYDP